jgi:uncharacterized membrane-anchored protein YjiN (DUF445 family)
MWGMPNQDLRFTIHASDFQDFSQALAAFNKRTEQVNAKLKKAKYQKVNRFPVDHAGTLVSVCLGIKDRSKVLFQELTGIVDKFKLNPQTMGNRPKNQTMAQAAAKAVSKPVQPVSRQWGLWVPCESEEAARAAAGFLAAIAKVGQPQVECRG